MNWIVDFTAFTEWIPSQDAAWLFLLILGLVLAVMVVWSRSLRPDNTRDPEQDR
jgi:hypothetical protein